MKKKTLFCLTILIALFSTSNLYSQINAGGFPIEEDSQNCMLKSASAIPTIVMPKADFGKEKKRGPLCGRVFAHKFDVDINIKKEGKQTQTNGFNIWKLAVKSEDAYSLNLIFKDFVVPEGARLFLYSPHQEQILGAYTSANNTEYNFAISPIDGDEIVVAYEEPVSASFQANIVLKSVNHDYVGLKNFTAFELSKNCEINAAIDSIHLARRSVCELIIDGIYSCSGNLINNTLYDANPYIITSSHCYWDYANNIDTNMVHTTIAFFNYESPNEEWRIEGSREMSLSGARVVSSRRSRDMMLIKLNEVPPVDYRPYYAGWNRESTVSGPVYTFHHPQGDVKKVSFDAATPSCSTFNKNYFEENMHWCLDLWDEGMTEKGSSGCALFDNEDLIIGCLTGGNTKASCAMPGDDYFWQFYKIWNDSTERKSLHFWLDPNNSEVTSLGGMEPYKNPCRRVTHRGALEVPAVQEVEENNYYAVGTNQLGLTEFAEKFTQIDEITLYGVYFFPVVGLYNSKRPIYLRIYQGSDKPDSLVYEQVVRIQTNQFNRKFFTEDTYSWGGVENYLRLTSPVKLKGNYFVSFSVPSLSDNSPFALYYSEPKSSKNANTAFFKTEEGAWTAFTEHPTIEAATSLMVDVVVRDGWNNVDTLNPAMPIAPPDGDSSYKQQKQKDEIILYPTVTEGVLNIHIPKDDVLEKVIVVDMSGHTLHRFENINATEHYQFDVDDVCRHNNVYNLIAEFKYAKNITFRFVKWRTNSAK